MRRWYAWVTHGPLGTAYHRHAVWSWQSALDLRLVAVVFVAAHLGTWYVLAAIPTLIIVGGLLSTVGFAIETALVIATLVHCILFAPIIRTALADLFVEYLTATKLMLGHPLSASFRLQHHLDALMTLQADTA